MSNIPQFDRNDPQLPSVEKAMKVVTIPDMWWSFSTFKDLVVVLSQDRDRVQLENNLKNINILLNANSVTRETKKMLLWSLLTVISRYQLWVIYDVLIRADSTDEFEKSAIECYSRIDISDQDYAAANKNIWDIYRVKNEYQNALKYYHLALDGVVDYVMKEEILDSIQYVNNFMFLSKDTKS